jgi:sugar lactone lactonase YvrE
MLSWSGAHERLGASLVIGPNGIAVTSDGSHSIFVGAMWAQGIWRYVEP